MACTHWSDGGGGAVKLAEAVMKACDQPNKFKYLYELDLPIKDKMTIIAQEMYGAKNLELSPHVDETIKNYEAKV